MRRLRLRRGFPYFPERALTRKVDGYGGQGRYGPRMTLISFKQHRFPTVIFEHAVWLYARFTLSFRDVEELLADQGIDVSNESVRRWFLNLGGSSPRNLHRNRQRASASPQTNSNRTPSQFA